MVSRTLDIDEELYDELEYLSKNVYDASISKLVNAAIEGLIESENIRIYKRKRNDQARKAACTGKVMTYDYRRNESKKDRTRIHE